MRINEESEVADLTASILAAMATLVQLVDTQRRNKGLVVVGIAFAVRVLYVERSIELFATDRRIAFASRLIGMLLVRASQIIGSWT